MQLITTKGLELDFRATAGTAVGEVVRAALSAVDPAQAVKRYVFRDGNRVRVADMEYDLATCEHVYVVGAGKASAAMAVALEETLGSHINTGWINTKDGYTAPTHSVTLHEARHPLPDERGVEGSRRIVDILRRAGPQDLVFCLISGGGSALMTLPADGITLADMEILTRALLRCGATINEMNAIRKHISQLKGGDLARAAAPAHVISLIVSDVIGNPLDVISSGPTSPDTTTFADAYGVLDKYHLLAEVPASVVERLCQGMAGRIPETPKQNDPVFEHVQNLVIASNDLAAQAAADKARELGMHSLVLSTFVEGEAREVAKVFAAIAREMAHSGRPLPRPALVVAGGETTVTVHGNGLGGRNQELALAAAPYIAGLPHVAILTLGTDGTDGPTDAAGAVCTGSTLARAEQQELRPAEFLANNDAYHFFQALGDLVMTGPTNTNVNDLTFVFAL